MKFSKGIATEVSSQQIKQVKEWIYQCLEIDEETSISLSQLQCTEPECPPIETVILVMKNPVQQYKIHKKIADIEYADISLIIGKT